MICADSDSSLSSWSSSDDSEAKFNYSNTKQAKLTSVVLKKAGDVVNLSGKVTLSPIRMRHVLEESSDAMIQTCNFNNDYLKHLVPIYWNQKHLKKDAITLSENLVVREIIWLLSGNGSVFADEKNAGALDFHRLQIMNVSHECVFNCMMRFSKLSISIHRLQSFVSTPKQCLTLQALQSWLHGYLMTFKNELQRFSRQSSLTLMQFALWIRKRWALEIVLLERGLESVLPPFGCAVLCQSICDLIYSLQTLLDRMSSCNILPITQKTILGCFYRVFDAQLQIAYSWMRSGRLNDAYREFFIVACRGSTDFKLIPSKSKLLNDIGTSLILAGKSAKYMQKLDSNLLEKITSASDACDILNICINYANYDDNDFDLQMSPIYVWQRIKNSVCRFCDAICFGFMQELINNRGLGAAIYQLNCVYCLFAMGEFCLTAFEDESCFDDITYLNLLLQNSLVNCSFNYKPAAISFASIWTENWSIVPREGLTHPEPKSHSAPFSNLTLMFQADWPLSEVITSDHILIYNDIFRFLIVFLRARYVLTRLRFEDLQAATSATVRVKLQLLRFSVLNFLVSVLSTTLQYLWYEFLIVNDNVPATSLDNNSPKTASVESVLKARNVGRAKQLHDDLLLRLAGACLLLDHQQLLHRPLIRIAVLAGEKLPQLWQNASQCSVDRLQRLQDDYDRCYRFVLSILNLSKTANPSLETLHLLLTFTS